MSRSGLWFRIYTGARSLFSALGALWPSPQLLTVLLVVASLFALAGIYLGTQHTVVLDINGEVVKHRTHLRTPEQVLREAGVQLQPADLVEAPPEDGILHGLPIRVRVARHVVMVHDGTLTQAYTQAQHMGGVAEELGVHISPHDALLVEGAVSGLEAPLPTPDRPSRGGLAAMVAAMRRSVRVTVRRAVPLTVQDGPVPLAFYTTARTVGEALYEQGLVVYAGDRIFPDLNTLVSPDLSVYVERSRPMVLDIGGQAHILRTRLKTVAEVLDDWVIDLGPKDYVVPELETEVQRDLRVSVVRVADEYVIEEVPIPFVVRTEPNPDMEIDTSGITQSGSEGATRRRIRVRYENNQPIYQVEEDEWVAREPEDRVFSYGTKIVLRDLETADGVITYWRKVRVRATSYNAATAGKSRDHPTYGITRLGTKARKGIVAVDPRVIPLRQRVYVPGYGTGSAEDTGGAIVGRRIDLCYDDDNLVLWNRWVDVYLLAPAPPAGSIQWILPEMP
ncbi:MAG: ubiquitin-like domain-containing protein [Anaerolineae bacterium]